MKNSRRLLSMITALTIALCAAGCGSDSADTNKADKNGAGSTVREGKTADKEIFAGADTAPTEAAGEDFTAEAEIMAEGFAEDYAEYDMAVDGETLKTLDGSFDRDLGAEGIAPETNGIPAAARTLTAGEWNDNDNWGFFTNLINSGAIGFPSFGIDPRYRAAVHVTDSSGDPVVNAKTTLIAEGDMVLWSAVTDKNGNAYLFTQGEPLSSYEALEVIVSANGKSVTSQVAASASDEQGGSSDGGASVDITFDEKTSAYKKTEIMFIVDATGSMADEMLFLQSEFSAIAEEIGTDNTTYSVNFYRDEGDDYVTKCSPFTDDISKLQSQLNSESADGGGDYPEAVAQILDETITNGAWSEDSVKLAFLIFDAPPHNGTEDMLKTAIFAASEKGIRLIPVVSSNADRDTELFGRAISICTGGTYVFLTDDSGIGGSHLEPIIGDYKVEKLYDIIIRVINNYKQ